MVLLALEIQDRIDDVLERLGPGQVAVLCDMPDEERGDVLPFGRKQELRRRFAHLPAKCAAAWRSTVDLPMPGSPPMRTSDPGTTPPPRTRSNSPIPVVSRSATTVSMSA